MNLRDTQETFPIPEPRASRTPLRAAYTRVELRCAPSGPYNLIGHAYNVSTTGLLVELDNPLAAGQMVDARLYLPGHEKSLNFRGRMVRMHEAEEVGPARMGLTFINLTPAQRDVIAKLTPATPRSQAA